MRIANFFAVALAALTIASCSKEEIGGSNNGGNVEGVNTPTYATFKFNIGGAGSRATGDFDPTENPEKDVADAQIGRLQLLIFNAASQALEYNGVMAAGETSKTVLLTAGKKKIFFVANTDKLTDYTNAITPAAFAPGTKTLADFYAMNFSAGTPQQIVKNQDAATRTFDLSELHELSNTTAGSEAGLPMSNTNEVTYTLVAGVSEGDAQGGTATADGTSATNTFKVQLYYMIAKARLALAGGVLSGGDDVKPVVKDVFYSIRNLARATNYVQNVPTAGSPQSYYYTSTFADQAAFNAEFDYASNIKVPATETAGDYLYVPENNHSMLLRGQSSYFAIKATFEPVVISAVAFDVKDKVKYTKKKLAEADANKNYIYTTQDVQGIPAGTYFSTLSLFEEAAWMMKNGIPFTEANRDEARALITAPTSIEPTVGGDYMSFTGANSYYRVDLGDGVGADTQYGVLRSNKYNATINKITGPGVPSEEDLIVDPTDPVSARTYISATIIPAEWKAISQSADL